MDTMTPELYAQLDEDGQIAYLENHEDPHTRRTGRLRRIVKTCRPMAELAGIKVSVAGYGVQCDDGKGLRWEVYLEEDPWRDGRVTPPYFKMWSGQAKSITDIMAMTALVGAVMGQIVATTPRTEEE